MFEPLDPYYGNRFHYYYPYSNTPGKDRRISLDEVSKLVFTSEPQEKLKQSKQTTINIEFSIEFVEKILTKNGYQKLTTTKNEVFYQKNQSNLKTLREAFLDTINSF